MAKRRSTTASSPIITAEKDLPTRFEDLGLSNRALAAVSDMGYEAPTPVQAASIPAVLAGTDVMAAAQTGTGKTAAFLLPALDRLGHARHGQGPLMLVVTPTRELAAQIEEVANAICARTGHTATVLVGGVSYEPQRTALRKGCDLVVATPGRLIDLINSGDCNLSQVETLVLDEADRMLDMGFLPDMRRIVAKTPASRQTLLFSATLSDDVLDNTKSLVNNPVRIEIAHKGTAAETIDQYVLPISHEAKNDALIEILHREGAERVIVFVRGKHRADAVCRRLRKAGIECAPIHGNRNQNQRASALRRFADGEVGVLVATDILARGIDIPNVSYVVNLDVPSDAEDYIHRIGRTGRAGEYGWALTFATPEEEFDLRDIERLMGKNIPVYPRAQGIALGEKPLVLDPGRTPTDRLPGKKERKKLVDERREERMARTAEIVASRSQRKAQPQRATSKSIPAAAAIPPEKPKAGRRRSKTASRQRTQAKRPEAAGRAGRPQGRRHPGDHGGMARR
jgi:ATP-dependent RNA helicase RhlE